MLGRHLDKMIDAKRRSRDVGRSMRTECLEPRLLMTVVISPQEQLFVELINRARADPVAEVRRNADVVTLNQDVAEDRLISSDPKQPLAPHQSLSDAMGGHLEDMLRRNYFGHDSPEGETPSDRALAAGYPVGAGENIAWSGNSGGVDPRQEIYDRHDGLFLSVGHRVNMMRPNWREVGPGVRYGIFTQDGSNFQSIMAGSMFGDRGGDSFITGVVISDAVLANNFYDIGEGIGNATVRAVNTVTAEIYDAQTGPAGGYSLQVPNGTYEVTATGNKISRPLFVRAVHVNDANVKVDFNSSRMDTRRLTGRIFEDVNGNRRRDSGDRVLRDVTVFADLNQNGQLDPGEPSDVSDSTGLYELDSLLPGEYVIRADLAGGWQATTGNDYHIDATNLNIVGIDFGLQEDNLPPLAASDQASGLPGTEITIAVLQNDSDPEGVLDSNSIQLTELPQYGSAFVRNGLIVYQSHDGYRGGDQFSYTVADDSGLRSNRATVSIQVGSAWQNAVEPRDVDGDGVVIPRDVLTVVLSLNQLGSRYIQAQPRSTGDPYLDVSGDGYVSPIDVLHIVQFLNATASGEPPARVLATDAFFFSFGLAMNNDKLAK